jgi:hypothetical protein
MGLPWHFRSGTVSADKALREADRTSLRSRLGRQVTTGFVLGVVPGNL